MPKGHRISIMENTPNLHAYGRYSEGAANIVDTGRASITYMKITASGSVSVPAQ